jgi:hypothetical protein
LAARFAGNTKATEASTMVHKGPVLQCRFTFERALCEVAVTQHRTTQGEPVFTAYAYEPNDADHERRRVLNDKGNPYEVLGSTASDAAERLADSLEQRFGRRVSGPDALPDFSSPRVIR